MICCSKPINAYMCSLFQRFMLNKSYSVLFKIYLKQIQSVLDQKGTLFSLIKIFTPKCPSGDIMRDKLSLMHSSINDMKFLQQTYHKGSESFIWNTYKCWFGFTFSEIRLIFWPILGCCGIVCPATKWFGALNNLQCLRLVHISGITVSVFCLEYTSN